jgi:hypothetical protein
MLKLSAIKGGALVSGVLSILGGSSPSYAATFISNTFSTPENTTLNEPAPGVGLGSSGITFYQFGPPPTGSFSGLTTIMGLANSSTDGSFTFVPQAGFTGTVDFIVEGVISASPFNGIAVTDHIVVTGVTPPVMTTPLPAALPLFATALGALGLLGWRRKKKTVAFD